MDPSADGAPRLGRVAEIRGEIEVTRARIVATIEALRLKADVPARLGDSVGNAAATFTEHVIDSLTAEQGDDEPSRTTSPHPTREATETRPT